MLVSTWCLVWLIEVEFRFCLFVWLMLGDESVSNYLLCALIDALNSTLDDVVEEALQGNQHFQGGNLPRQAHSVTCLFLAPFIIIFHLL